MKKVIWAAIWGVTPLISGCATDIPSFYPLAQAISVDVDSDTIKTTAIDSVIHRQKLGLGELVTLDKNVSVPPYTAYKYSHDVPAETKLHFGMLLDTEFDGESYCTVERTSMQKSLFGDKYYGYSCFRDTDGSGDFDVVFSKGAQAESVISGKVQAAYYLGAGGNPFAIGYIGGLTELAVSAPYTKTEQQYDSDIELVIKFVPGNRGNDRLEVFRLEGNFEKAMINASTDIPADLPAILDVQGAKIEALKFEDGVLEYRVISGFDANAPILSDFR